MAEVTPIDIPSPLRSILDHADIRVNGDRPWDMLVHDDRVFNRVLSDGSLGLGESYMDRWWDCKQLDQFFFHLMRSDFKQPFSWVDILMGFKARFLNMQDRKKARRVAEEHYDLSTELYEAFLDPYNQYTCGYFQGTENLNEAQENKLDLICRKLQLSAEDRILDIGCGWGGFAKFAAERYGCSVTGISISEEQVAYAKNYCKGLPVEILYKDYRDLEGEYDKVLICGMIEHVGYKNYRTIFEAVRRVLSESGLFLLHTIGSSISCVRGDPWMDRYIFPGGMLPSISQIGKAMEELFVMEDWHNFGAYYAKTLMCWCENFERNVRTLSTNYSERFQRMFRYYLLSMAGTFRARHVQLWQVVMSRGGVVGGYQSVR